MQGRLRAFVRQIQNQAGSIFGVMEVRSRSASAELLVNTILEELERAANTLEETSNVQHRFEQILEAINERVAALIPEMGPGIRGDDIQAIIGVAVGSTMYLSGCGELSALFLHKMEDQRYQVFNLSRSIQTEAAKTSLEKLFAVVLDGDLHAGDIFCVCNQALQQEMASEELNGVLTTLPPAGASAKIRHYFPIDINLAMFVLKAQLPDEAAPTADRTPRPERASAASSLSQLEEAQEKTGRLLADQGSGFRIPGQAMLRRFFQDNRRGARGLLKSLGRLSVSVVLIGGKMLLGLVSGSAAFAKKMAGRQRGEALRSARGNIERVRTNILRLFHRLPKTSKYLVLAAVVLIFVFAASISVLSQSHARQQEQKAFAAEITAVEERRDQAAGARIYKDEAQARALLQIALSTLAAIHADTPEEQAEVDRLKQELTAMQDELRHVVNVPNPPLIADFSGIGVNAAAATLEGGLLSVFGSDGNGYRVDTQTRTFSKIDVGTRSFGFVQEADSEDGELYLLDDQGLTIYAQNPPALFATDTSPRENERWVDLYSYANRVYVLNPGGGGIDPQILRFSRSGEARPTGDSAGRGFGADSNWIRARSSDLSDAVSLAVDGTVFVMKENGAIVRFTSGSEVGWTQGTIDPPLSAATDLWTSAESDFLYVLEPSTQRLVVYEKESGNFLVQYRSDAFVGLSDMVIDEANKAIYLLAGARVYRIDASHVK